jgi:hypothetical protein
LKLVAVAASESYLRLLFTLCSGSEKFQQHAVTLLFELRD